MKPTDILKSEHEHIQQMLRVIEAVCLKLESEEKVEPDHLGRIVEFIKGFADACHHAKEEDLLFKAMESAGFPREAGPIAVMLNEHEQGRTYVKEMSRAADAYRQGDRQSGVRFAQNARGYVRLLSQHILKENNVLFPMADQHLTEQQQEKLLADFKTVEHDRLGEGTHEKFLGMLQELKKIYWP